MLYDIEDIKSAMANLTNPEDRCLLALRQFHAASTHMLSLGPKNDLELYIYGGRNIMQQWINEYGEYIPRLSTEDNADTKEWQIPAEQIGSIIEPYLHSRSSEDGINAVQGLFAYAQDESNRARLAAAVTYQPL